MATERGRNSRSMELRFVEWAEIALFMNLFFLER
jgi:hypothetical protein